jgi:adenylate cyclase
VGQDAASERHHCRNTNVVCHFHEPVKTIFYIFGLSLISNICFAQEGKIDSLQILIEQSEIDTVKVQLMLDLSKEYFGSDPQEAISISNKAFTLSKSVDYDWGMGYSLKNIGIGYYFISDYVQALVYWKQAKLIFEESNDRTGVANMLSNIGAIYSDQGFYVRSLELYMEALKLAEELSDSSRIATVTQNIGAIHHKNKNYEESLRTYLKGLSIFESLNEADGMGLASRNIAEIYYAKDQYDSAQFYGQKSLKFLEGTAYYSQAFSILGLTNIAKGSHQAGLAQLNKSYEYALSVGNKVAIAQSLNALAKGYEEIGNLNLAIENFEKSKLKSLEISYANEYLEEVYSSLIRLYRETGALNKVREYNILHGAVMDSLQNMESVRAQNKLLFDYEITKKEQEIALLIKDNEIQRAQEEKQKLIKNGFIYGFILTLVFAIVFLFQRNQIKKGKKLSDKLLHNILPDNIAQERKDRGESIAKEFDKITVLFSDFKGFTKISESLSAQELVGEINTCFKAFDSIITSYGIEKIKTIGDSYMAAGGLNISRTSSTKDVVMAGLEMQDYIRDRKIELESKGKPFFEMRIGIHTGPVVAGIVGDKKFQYDIWGDTVNIASRMESSGEVGKVNISQATCDLLKDDPDLMFDRRGKISAKGKGEMEMFFVLKNLSKK